MRPSGWGGALRFLRQREAGFGLILGAAAGLGFLLIDWLAGIGAATEWHRWARIGYVVFLAISGAIAGSLYGRAQEQAITDPLTGLFNRRYFFTVSPHWFARARRNGEPVSLLIIDVDNFKQINDRLGHNEGDRVLQTVARAIQETCRGSDIAVRWGGEEFAVLLPETDAVGAERAATRISTTVRERCGVTISFGTATFPDVHEEALVKLADRRMYEHKHNKRTTA